MIGIVLENSEGAAEMNQPTRLKEDPVSSCRSLVRFVASIPDEKGKCMALRDLCWRLATLPPLPRALVMAEAFHCTLPEEIGKDFNKERLGMADIASIRKDIKQAKDAAIFTIKGVELKAALMALGQAPDKAPDTQIGEYSYWFVELEGQNGRPLSVVLTLVGEALNVPCAIAVEHLLSNFNVSLLMVCGIAAGPRSKVSLGDIVYAERIYDYEHVRLELASFGLLKQFFGRQRPRPKYLEVRQVVKSSLERLDHARIKSSFTKALTNVEESLLPKGYSGKLPEVHNGTVAAGEKLIADGSLEKMVKVSDQRIRAGDMEDSGFAQVASFKHIPWCSFRGISDYGDPDKENGWQFVAALGASSAGIAFLESVWSKE